MKCLIALCLAFGLLPAYAASQSPVTQSEASAVFAKAERVMKSVLQFKTPAPAFPKGASVATREQILNQLQAIFEVVKVKFKFTPPKLPSAPSVISFKASKAKELALRLEVLGFIDRFGPLATSKTEGLSTQEFGDALGYFMARVAELTHMPSSRFSPYLSG